MLDTLGISSRKIFLQDSPRSDAAAYHPTAMYKGLQPSRIALQLPTITQSSLPPHSSSRPHSSPGALSSHRPFTPSALLPYPPPHSQCSAVARVNFVTATTSSPLRSHPPVGTPSSCVRCATRARWPVSLLGRPFARSVRFLARTSRSTSGTRTNARAGGVYWYVDDLTKYVHS